MASKVWGVWWPSNETVYDAKGDECNVKASADDYSAAGNHPIFAIGRLPFNVDRSRARDLKTFELCEQGMLNLISSHSKELAESRTLLYSKAQSITV